MIAYEMYCGQRCFEGKSQKEVFGRIIRGEWTWPEDRTPRKQMRLFVEECLRLKPEDRPSASEALEHEWFAVFHQKEEEEQKQCSMSIDDDVSDISINVKTGRVDNLKWQQKV